MKAVANTAIVIIYLFMFCSRAFAQSAEEKSFLSMYFKEEDLVVQSATRSPQPLSFVAENMSVVTAAEIERMNAHTLADVLNTITGVEVFMLGGPGSLAQASILGSSPNHATVLMDGVILNNVNTNLAQIGQFPVQNIERIEIIKGPASSAWGSALGGVINVITKSGRSMDQGSLLSASYGTNNFGDFRAEARGKQGGLAYYMTAGRLQAGELTPRMALWNNNAYAKLGYDITDRTKVQLSLDYIRFKLGGGLFALFDETYKYFGGYMHASLGLTSALTKDLTLDVSIRTSKQPFTTQVFMLSTGDNTYTAKDVDSGYGESAKITWKGAFQTVVMGIDDDSRKNEDPLLQNGRQHVDRWGVYVNDTFALGRFTVTPGIRFDRTNLNGDFTSPSLGMTYGMSANTVIRAYAARGFNNPTPGDSVGNGGGIVPNPDLKMETVKSYQAGAETAALKYVWFKVMAFRDDLRDGLSLISLSPTASQVQNVARQRRDGVTIEAKTAPVFNTSLSVGAEFITTKDLDTGENVRDLPTQVYDIALAYNDGSWSALLQGRHINWNARDAEQSKYHSMLIDMNVAKKLFERKDVALEAFATAHNLLNTAQYLMYIYSNPERWYEAGLRYKF